MNPIILPFMWLQKFVTTNQQVIKKISYLLMAGLISFFCLTLINKSYRIYWNELGSKSASISLVLFWITLVPGILKRFQFKSIFIPIRVILMLFRRQIGILMYLFALTHYFWSRFLPIWLINGDLLSFSLFEFFGLGAFMLAFPMFITSNELSVNKLGKLWKTIHSVTYIIIWLLFLHVVIREPGIKALVTLVMGCLTVASLMKEKNDLV
ncbi:MAG: ferric reductase-like transmembrane domain-containing protein [Candidatus Pacebacteria bacterium]|nr:ferric reductase-like transmembrane domain-containing protein [Candidatus Paceibacterota bacterium]